MSAEDSTSPPPRGASDHDPHPSKPTSKPRVWLLTGADSAIGIAVARAALQAGDSVVACAQSAKAGYASSTDPSGPAASFASFVSSVRSGPDTTRRALLVIGLNARLAGDCQAAVAQAARHFGRVDVLLACASEALFGTVEELAASARARAAIRDQFSTNLFAPVNVMRALLPLFRAQRAGHIMVLTGITAHIGTPGLSAYCASQWAVEGYCDSLAYEVAPFGVRITIVQPSIEVAILTNPIVAAPSMPEYSRENNPAPLSRSLFASLLDRIDDAAGPDDDEDGGARPAGRGSDLLNAKTEMARVTPRLPADMKKKLLAETLHAIMQIGGHENPPARHIVGHEGVASVKEKLKTVSEEMEEFVSVSDAVDYQQGS